MVKKKMKLNSKSILFCFILVVFITQIVASIGHYQIEEPLSSQTSIENRKHPDNIQYIASFNSIFNRYATYYEFYSPWMFSIWSQNSISNIYAYYNSAKPTNNITMRIKIENNDRAQLPLNIYYRDAITNEERLAKTINIERGTSNLNEIIDLSSFNFPQVKELRIEYKSMNAHRISLYELYIEVFIPAIDIKIIHPSTNNLNDPVTSIPNFDISITYKNYNEKVLPIWYIATFLNTSSSITSFNLGMILSFITTSLNQYIISQPDSLFNLAFSLKILDQYGTPYLKNFLIKVDKKAPGINIVSDKENLANGICKFELTPNNIISNTAFRYELRASSDLDLDIKTGVFNADLNKINITTDFDIQKLMKNSLEKFITLTLKVTDYLGNQYTTTFTEFVNKTVPEITLNDSNMRYLTGNTYTLRKDSTYASLITKFESNKEIKSWNFELKAGTRTVTCIYNNTNGEFNAPNLNEMLYSLNIMCIDNYGVRNSTTYLIFLDSAVPIISEINAPRIIGSVPTIKFLVEDLFLNELYYTTSKSGLNQFPIPYPSPLNSPLRQCSFILDSTIWESMPNNDEITITIHAKDFYYEATKDISIIKNNDIPVINEIAINGIVRPNTLPIIYINNYAESIWDIKFTTVANIKLEESSLKFTGYNPLTKNSGGQENSIIFTITNADFPNPNNEIFQMDLIIKGENDVILNQLIWLIVIKAAPTIEHSQYTNGLIHVNSSKKLEKIEITIDLGLPFVYEGIFQNQTFNITSYLPNSQYDGTRGINIWFTDLSGNRIKLESTIVIDQLPINFELKQNNVQMIQDSFINSWNNISYSLSHPLPKSPIVDFWYEIPNKEQNGKSKIIASIKNAAGTTTTKEFTFYFDNTPPKIIYNGPTKFGNDTPTLTFLFDEQNVESINFSYGNHKAFKTMYHTVDNSVSFEIFHWNDLPSGNNDVEINITDRAKNIKTYTYTIQKINYPPKIESTYPIHYSSYKNSQAPFIQTEIRAQTNLKIQLTIINETFEYYIEKGNNDILVFKENLTYWPYESRINVSIVIFDEFNNSQSYEWIMYRTDVPGWVRDNNLNLSNMFTAISWQVWIIMILNIGLVIFFCYYKKEPLKSLEAGKHLAIVISIGLASMVVVSMVPSYLPGFLMIWATYWLPQLIIMQIFVALFTFIVGLLLIGAITWADAKKAFKDLFEGFRKVQDLYEGGSNTEKIAAIKDWVFNVNAADSSLLSPKDLIRHYQMTTYPLGRVMMKTEKTVSYKVGKLSNRAIRFMAFIAKISPLMTAVGMAIILIALILAIDNLLGHAILRSLIND